jgi:ring-1,2-phenylacetyl-CoA epoxidase subunit PaaC
MLDPYLKEALVGKLTALADDEVVLAQRLSEWVAHAPILEEDIAIANLAQDELGHAKLYLELRQELDGSDPDQVVFLRDPLDYGNAVLVELPRGDWAFTMVRQYLFDAYEGLWLREAASSRYAPGRSGGPDPKRGALPPPAFVSMGGKARPGDRGVPP